MTTAHPSLRILVVVDEPGVRNLISLALKHQGYSPQFVEDPRETVSHLRHTTTRYSAMLVNASSNEPILTELVSEARQQHPPIAIIGLGDSITEIDRDQFDEVIVEPVNGENLRKALQACLRTRQNDLSVAGETVRVESGAVSSVWRSRMQPLIRQIATADVPVLVQGETGTGKEVMARQLHALSPRSKKPFLKVNCAALPSELIESELFGYERGAFTGAFKTTPGKFEMTEGGVILLDEIGDMDFKLQAKLLQVLQDKEFIRLGSSGPRKVDVRVIAATHCNLEHAIEEGRFREDLYYRLNIITIHVPALRDRKDEIIPLAYHFMQQHATPTAPLLEISPMLRDVLLNHDWPGNIRELENVIRKVLVLRRPDVVAEEIRTRVRRRLPVHTFVPAEAAQTVSTTPVKEPITFPSPAPVAEPFQEIAVAATANGSRMHAAYISEPAYGRAHGNIHQDFGSRKEAPQPSVINGTRSAPQEEPDQWSVLERVDQARRAAETEAIMTALSSTLWNRKRAAELLNVDYKALLYKMKKLGIVERASRIAV